MVILIVITIVMQMLYKPGINRMRDQFYKKFKNWLTFKEIVNVLKVSCTGGRTIMNFEDSSERKLQRLLVRKLRAEGKREEAAMIQDLLLFGASEIKNRLSQNTLRLFSRDEGLALSTDAKLSRYQYNFVQGDKILYYVILKSGLAMKKSFIQKFSTFRKKVLLSAAKKLGCKYIFTPELSVDIASNLLTNVSLGKGSQISMDTGFCDDRDSDVKILRPLRTFDMKELAFYNALHDLDPVCVRQPEINQYSSIQVLMKHFISDLQENYPATIATVVRTGDKLALDEKKIIGKCKLCEGALFAKTSALDSEESTKFSKLVSSELPDHSISRQDRYEKIKEKFDNQSQKRTEYCFSCSRISEYLLEDRYC